MPNIEDRLPLLARGIQTAQGDRSGGVQFQTLTESEAAGDVAFAGPIADLILYNLANGTFSQGPSDPGSNIEPVNNPLPYWTGPTQVSGGAITASWAADSSSPSGQNLRLAVPPGATNDEAYVEQIVPIGGNRMKLTGLRLRATYVKVAASGNMTAAVSMQYLKADGTTTGTAASGTQSISAGPYSVAASSSVEGDAAFVRVRIGLQRGAAADTATATIDVSDVRLEVGRPFVLLPDTADSATYAMGSITQAIGVLDMTPAGGGNSMPHIYMGSGGVTIYNHLTGVGAAAIGFDSTGLVALTGGQLQFPATQIPSADANTLDDYEEGTWTPSLSYATVGTSSWVVTTQVGWYTKIGNLVNFTMFYQGVPTNGTGAGNLKLTGLPFTAANNANEQHQNACNMQGWTKATYTSPTLQVLLNTTTAQFSVCGSGVANANLAVGDIPSGGTVIVRSSGIYMV